MKLARARRAPRSANMTEKIDQRPCTIFLILIREMSYSSNAQSTRKFDNKWLSSRNKFFAEETLPSYWETQCHIAALTLGLWKTERSAKIIFEDSIRNIILSFYIICRPDLNELETFESACIFALWRLDARKRLGVTARRSNSLTVAGSQWSRKFWRRDCCWSHHVFLQKIKRDGAHTRYLALDQQNVWSISALHFRLIVQWLSNFELSKPIGR